MTILPLKMIETLVVAQSSPGWQVMVSTGSAQDSKVVQNRHSTTGNKKENGKSKQTNAVKSLMGMVIVAEGHA